MDKDKTYKISNLSKSIKRKIKREEESLGCKCTKIWSFTNPKNQQYLFGYFGTKEKRIIVTIEHYIRYIQTFVPSK